MDLLHALANGTLARTSVGHASSSKPRVLHAVPTSEASFRHVSGGGHVSYYLMKSGQLRVYNMATGKRKHGPPFKYFVDSNSKQLMIIDKGQISQLHSGFPMDGKELNNPTMDQFQSSLMSPRIPTAASYQHQSTILDNLALDQYMIDLMAFNSHCNNLSLIRNNTPYLH
uniref:Uncharacterized protein n=1 Tax=Nelumbo nucifera TaxID=4432 RepID=A0A822YFN8_NELNU|nr:TPA_asm: hypothetical protein HUJ06_031253 [Nelumbo nucifera]